MTFDYGQAMLKQMKVTADRRPYTQSKNPRAYQRVLPNGLRVMFLKLKEQQIYYLSVSRFKRYPTEEEIKMVKQTLAVPEDCKPIPQIIAQTGEHRVQFSFPNLLVTASVE